MHMVWCGSLSTYSERATVTNCAETGRWSSCNLRLVISAVTRERGSSSCICGVFLRLRPCTSTSYSPTHCSKYAAVSGLVVSSHSHTSSSEAPTKAGKYCASAEFGWNRYV